MFSSPKRQVSFRCKLLGDKQALQFESTKGPPEFPGLMAVSVLRSSIGGEGSPSYLVALNTIICASTSRPRTARCCPCCNIKTMSYESPPEKKNESESLQKRLFPPKQPGRKNSATKLRSIFPTVIARSDPVLTPHRH